MIYNKHFRKRISCIVLAVIMVFSTIPEIHLYGGEMEKTVEEDDVKVYTLENRGGVSGYGYQDVVWVDENGNTKEQSNARLQEEEALSKGAGESFPLRYSMVEEGVLPSVRNQGQWGTCWAHAAICALETNMVKKGLADSLSVDYSERHLSYFAHKRNGLLGDGKDSYEDGYGWYGGGNFQMAVFQLGAWYGAALESDFPYSSYGDMEDLGEEYRNTSACHLLNAYELNTYDDIKGAVMNYGSVICSYYSDNDSVDYNNFAVYHADAHNTNHAVSIVGWDDEFGREKFSGSNNGNMPSADGAWLCRNSWGENKEDKGYFWISYEDATLGNFCSFEADSSDNYDNIYLYDGAGFNSLIGCEKAANIFTAKSLEELKAVSFYSYGSCDYVIDIYVEGDVPMEVPSDGLHVYSGAGSVEKPGYHTVKLDKGIILDSEDRYAVSVKPVAKEGEQVWIYAEKGDDYSSDRGQSFLYTSGKKWVDTKDWREGEFKNICIKAFTGNLDGMDVSVLKSFIDTARSLKEEDYTVYTWDNLQVAVEKAKAVYNKENPAISEIMKSKFEIESAISNLLPSKVYIENEEDYENFAKSVSEGMDYKGQTVYLTRDLDLSNVTHYIAGNYDNPFEGRFEGGGFAIKNLKFSYKFAYGGLFGYIGKNGIVENLHITNADLSYDVSYTAGIAALNDGIISGCSIEGNILFSCTSGWVGGLVAVNNGTIKQSHINGKVEFPNQTSSSFYVGGLAGKNAGIISDCYMEGRIVADGNSSVGGIAGFSDVSSVIRRCYNLAVISGLPSDDTVSAGIVAFLKGKAEGCFNYGNIERTSQSGKNGALYSYLNGDITNCYYLEGSSPIGGYSPKSNSGSMTKEEFANGKTSYYLNSNGGTQDNSYYWSLKDGKPVLSDGNNKPVIRLLVTQDTKNNYKASINGIFEGELYSIGGMEVYLKVKDGIQDGYKAKVQAAGLLPSAKEGYYILPDKDSETIISCTKQCIDYNVIFNLNGGSGVLPCTYNIENSLKLPIPVKGHADFLGWYDNEEFVGNAVTSIEKGLTGEKEFWARWDNYGFRVSLPQIKGCDIVSCDGYKNTRIQEGESYLFEIKSRQGYDLSGIVVKCGENILVPSNGIYRIDNIRDDIDNISITGIKLAGGNYKIEGTELGNGYVGNSAKIVPVFPAVLIKAEGESEFSDSITVDTGNELRIITCDSEGNTSKFEIVAFNRDKTKPYVNSAVVSYVDESKKCKGVYITVNAVDLESGIAGYSIDGGLAWQQDCRFHMECMEIETVFDRIIYVKDYAGNIAEYQCKVNIPAADKTESAITLQSDKVSYYLGSDVVLTAKIIFDKEEPDVDDYGSVTFVSSDGMEAGTVKVTPVSGKAGKAQLIIPSSSYNAIGEMSYQAIYKGAGTPYRDCSSDICRFKIVKVNKPSSVSAVKISKNSIRIKWGRVKGAAGYQVYRRSGNGAYKKYKVIKGEKNVSIVNKNLSKSGKYYYKVRAYLENGNGKIYGGFLASKKVDMGKVISSDELKFNMSKVKLKVGKSKVVKLNYPKGRDKSQIKSVKYKSGKSDIAKVNSKGKVTAKKQGTCYVYATVKLKNGQSRKLRLKVNVI